MVKVQVTTKLLSLFTRAILTPFRHSPSIINKFSISLIYCTPKNRLSFCAMENATKKTKSESEVNYLLFASRVPRPESDRPWRPAHR